MLDDFPSSSTEASRTGASARGAGRHATHPRVLVLDPTRIGSDTATGQLKKRLFRSWPSDRLFQLYSAGSDKIDLLAPDLQRLHPRMVTRLEDIFGLIYDFEPEVIYYRPLESPPGFNHVCQSLIKSFRLPLVVHLMDDWPERLRRRAPGLYRRHHRQLQHLLEQASVRLSICPSMSEAFRKRYGVPFVPIANGVEPEEANTSSVRQYREQAEDPFTLRYCGALADDMNFRSVSDVARVVDSLQQVAGIRFEIFTMPAWRGKAEQAFAGLEGVTVRDIVNQDSYPELLATADGLLLAYNFDEASIAYVRHSMANKLPELLASGSPVVAYGPSEVATIGYAAGTGCVCSVTRRDPQALAEAILNLVRYPRAASQLGRKAREYVLEHHGLGEIRRQFKGMLHKAARTGKALLDHDTLMYRLGIARYPLNWKIFQPTDKYAPAEKLSGIHHSAKCFYGRYPREYVYKMSALRRLCSKFSTCVVLANGPSLNKVDLDRLGSVPTFGMNSIFLKYPGTAFRPTFHVVEDHLVGEDRADELNSLKQSIKLFPTYLAYCLTEDSRTVFFRHCPRVSWPDGFDFSLDASDRTYAGCTVSFTCLQLAYYFGFKRILLVGFDHNYKIPSDIKKSKEYDVEILDMESDDTNHFAPDYFGKGKRWHDPRVDMMEAAYLCARDVLKGQGVEVVNCTVGGHLEVFSRGDLARCLAAIPDRETMEAGWIPKSFLGKTAGYGTGPEP